MEPWQREVTKAQLEVSNYYNSEEYERYKRDEQWYWERCAAMMFFQERDNPNQVKSVLDVGCGYGTLAVFAKNVFDAPVYATDYKKRISNEMLNEYGITFKESDIEMEDIPFKSPKVFDVIIFTEILEHLYFNPLETLKKLRKKLAPSGVMYLSTPDAAQWGRVTKWYNHVGEMPMINPYKPDIDEHVYQWSEGELLRIIDESGFIVEEFHFSSPPFWGRHFNMKLRKKEIL